MEADISSETLLATKFQRKT